MMAPPITSFREFDQGLSREPVEDGTFAGFWVNTSSSPQGWQCLRTSLQGATPVIHATLSNGNSVKFSKACTFGGISSPELTAFSAQLCDETSRILLHANLNLGLLVLATFKNPVGGGTGYFSREFFARSRAPGQPAASGGNPAALFEQHSQTEICGQQALLGRWRNADEHTRGVFAITLEKDGTGITAHALGSPTSGDSALVDWGTANVEIFACLDEAGQPSLSALARWELDHLVAHFQLRIPGGTLVLAGFNEFGDGRMNYATREFFYRLTQ